MLKIIASLLLAFIPFAVSAQNVRVTESTTLQRQDGTFVHVRFEYDKEAKFATDKAYRERGEKLYRDAIDTLVKYDTAKIVNQLKVPKIRHDLAFEVVVRPLIIDHVYVSAYTPHPGVSFVLNGESVEAGKLQMLPVQLDVLHSQAREVAAIIGTRVD